MKQDTWRRQPAAYPLQGMLQPRFTDVDLWQHLNNVAQIGLHGELLQQWLQATLGADVWRKASPQLALRSNATHFLAEAHYPAPLATGVRLLGVDAAGLQLATALFQHGQGVGLHQAVLGAWDGGQSVPLPAPWLARLQAAWAAQAPLEAAATVDGSTLAAPPAAPISAPPAVPISAPPVVPLAPAHPDAWPWQIGIGARFGDADAHGNSSDFTLARCAEQGRVQFLTRVFGAQRLAAPVGFMVAHVALRWHRRSRAPLAWQLGIGVQRVGARSLSVRSALFDGAQHLADAESVMVVIDHATRRPEALPEAARAQLAAYQLPGV
jgi:acyl-CoA thioesterase FadM